MKAGRWENVRRLVTTSPPQKAPGSQGPSDMWETFFKRVSDEVWPLLAFARACGAGLTHTGGGWRIEAQKALGSEYPAWREAMMQYLREVRSALSSLPAPASASPAPPESKPVLTLAAPTPPAAPPPASPAKGTRSPARCEGCGLVVYVGEWQDVTDAAWCAVCWRRLEAARTEEIEA